MTLWDEFEIGTKVTDCHECLNYVRDSGYALYSACASVGISRNHSLLDMLRGYVAAYHYQNHKTTMRAWPKETPREPRLH